MLWEKTLLPAAPSYIAAGANDTYMGEWIENDGASGSVQALKDSTQSGTLTLQGSNDGVTIVQTVSATAGTGRKSTATLPATSKLYRVKYVNGATAETGTPIRFLLSSVALNEGEFVSMAVPGILGATAASRYVGATTAGAPASGTFRVGDFIVDQTGAFYVCTVAGTPGTWVAVSASSGTFTGDVIARSGAATQVKIGSIGGNPGVAFGAAATDTLADIAGVLTSSMNVSAPALNASGLTGATGASRYVGATASGAPVAGTYAVGDYIIDRTGKIYICTVAGTPGTWVQVGSGGSVTGYGFEFYATAIQTLTTATETTVVFGGTRTDTNTGKSGNTYVVPAGGGGLWHFYYRPTIDSSNATAFEVRAFLKKNTTTYLNEMSQYTTPSGDVYQNLSLLVETVAVADGDIFSITELQSRGGNTDMKSAQSPAIFGGIRLGA